MVPFYNNLLLFISILSTYVIITEPKNFFCGCYFVKIMMVICYINKIDLFYFQLVIKINNTCT